MAGRQTATTTKQTQSQTTVRPKYQHGATRTTLGFARPGHFFHLTLAIESGAPKSLPPCNRNPQGPPFVKVTLYSAAIESRKIPKLDLPYPGLTS